MQEYVLKNKHEYYEQGAVHGDLNSYVVPFCAFSTTTLNMDLMNYELTAIQQVHNKT